MNRLPDAVRARLPLSLRGRAGVAALPWALLVATVAGLALDGYSQFSHPLAWLGGRGIPHAAAFNALGFGLVGVLAALGGWDLRGRLDSQGWAARVGAWLLVGSALAFAAQGAWPIDPEDVEGPLSRRHAACWTLWWIASVAGAALLAVGLRSGGGAWRPVRLVCAVAAAAMVLLVVQPVPGLPPPLAHRLAVLAWLGCSAILCLRRSSPAAVR